MGMGICVQTNLRKKKGFAGKMSLHSTFFVTAVMRRFVVMASTAFTVMPAFAVTMPAAELPVLLRIISGTLA
jgi:hypothetical protein